MTQPDQSTLARKWTLEINTNTVASPVWTTVKGMNSLTVTESEPNLEDDNVYEDNGYTGSTKTGLSWNIEGTVMRRTLASDVTTYDVGQEKLRVLARTLGATGVAHVRAYDRNGGPEAFTGFGEVTWAPQGGEPTDLESVDFTITGKGINTQITNPNAPALALPTVTGLNPTTGTTAGGFLVIITGDNFKDRNGNVVVSGAASVKFAAANATSYTVIDRQTIAAIAPANTAGAKVVTVINTTGTSVVTQSLTYV